MFTSQFTNTHQFSTMGIEHCFRNVHFIGIIIVLKSTVPFKFVQPCKVKALINN